MNMKSIIIWAEGAWKPYISGFGQSELLLDTLVSQVFSMFVSAVRKVRILVGILLAGLHLQLPDMRCCMRLMNYGIRKQYSNWDFKKYHNLASYKLLSNFSRDITVD